MPDKKLSIIAIVVSDRLNASMHVNTLLSRYGDKIVARMGIPHNAKDVSLISVIMETNENDLNSIKTQLKTIPNVQIKTLTV